MKLDENETALLTRILQLNIDRLERNVWSLDGDDCHERAIEYAITIQIMEKLK